MAATDANAEHYRIEIKRVQRALAQPLQTGGGRSIHVRESVLLKVTAQHGERTGYGEAATLPWFGTESAEQAAKELEALGNIIALPIEGKGMERLDAFPCARFALESALRQADALPQLVAEQNTSAPQQKPDTATAMPVAALLPAGTSAVQPSLFSAGFRTFKTKIGVRTFAEEAASITALLRGLRERSGADAAAAAKTRLPDDQSTHSTAATFTPRFKVRLDANGSLSASVLSAWLELLAPLADYVDFIEQPLLTGQEAQTAAAFADNPLAFAFDESLTSLPQLLQISDCFPQAVLVVKPSLLGNAEGFLQWRNHCMTREKTGAATGGQAPTKTEPQHTPQCTCAPQHSAHRTTEPQHNPTPEKALQRRIIYSSALETGIGLHHALSLAAADPLPLEPVGFGTGNLFAQDGLGAPPLQAANLPRPLACNMPAIRAQMEAIWKRA